MQLGDDHALGTIDDEGTVLRHQRDFPHIDVLLFNVFDRLGGGFLVIDDQAHFHAQRAGVGCAAQHTFVHVKHGLTQGVVDVLQRCIAAVADNREDRFESCVQAVFATILQRDAVLSELAI